MGSRPWLLTATPFGADAWGEGRVARVVVPGATSPWLLSAAPFAFGAESKTAQHQNAPARAAFPVA